MSSEFPEVSGSRHGGSSTGSSSHVFQQKSRGTCQALLSPAKSDESLQMVRQQEGGLKIREEQPGDKVSVLQPG